MDIWRPSRGAASVGDMPGALLLNEPGVYPFPEPEAEVLARMTAALADLVAALPAASRGPSRAAVVSHDGSFLPVSRKCTPDPTTRRPEDAPGGVSGI